MDRSRCTDDVGHIAGTSNYNPLIFLVLWCLCTMIYILVPCDYSTRIDMQRHLLFHACSCRMGVVGHCQSATYLFYCVWATSVITI